MDRQQLRDHRDRLLQAGFGYRKVMRHIQELEAHYHDLCQEGREQGLNPEAARSWASSHLGSLQQISAAMLASCTQRSWLARYPKLMTMLVPLLIQVLIVCGVMLLLVATMEYLKGLEGSAFAVTQQYPWLEAVLQGLLFALMYLLTPLLSMALAMVAVRQQIPASYWMLGVLSICLLGSSLVLNIQLPAWSGDENGSLGGQLGYAFLPFPDFAHFANTTLRLLLNLAASYGLGWWHYQQQHTGFASRSGR